MGRLSPAGAAMLGALACGACASEGRVLGQPALPRLEQVGHSLLRPPNGRPALDFVDIPGDLDGDGIADLIASQRDEPVLYVRYGGPIESGDEPMACSIAFDGPIYPRAAGDVDGDGRVDLLVGSPSCQMYVVYGSSERLCGAAPGPLAIAACDGYVSPHAIGDVDGDGLADFVISPLQGRALLFYGRRDRLQAPLSEASADAVLMGDDPGEASGFFGYHVAPAGDTDGDGWRDFFVAAHSESLLYRGSPERLSGLVSPDRVAARLVDDSNGLHEPVGLTDVDGDGRGDVALNGQSALYAVYYGRPGPYDAPDAALDGTRLDGEPAMRAGDLNGDSAVDLVVAEAEIILDQEGDTVDAVHVLFGTGERLSGAVALLETATTWTGLFSERVDRSAFGSIAVGDLNGDGIDDLAVASSAPRGVVVVLGARGLGLR